MAIILLDGFSDSYPDFGSEHPVKKIWSIEVHKDYLKFSAAHFLIFPDGTAERLHGHNYRVRLEADTELDEHGLVINFQVIKPILRKLVDELNEHLLLPGKHPVLTINARDDGLTEVRYQERYYVIPSDEVIVLPIGNTSVENLAGWLADTMLERLAEELPSIVINRLKIGVEETVGQAGQVTVFPGEEA